MANDTERLAAVAKKVRNFSPSIIPDLRRRARIERERLGFIGVTSVDDLRIYGLDHVCDWLEELFSLFPDQGWPGDCNWAMYDQLRNYGQPIDTKGPP